MSPAHLAAGEKAITASHGISGSSIGGIGYRVDKCNTPPFSPEVWCNIATFLPVTGMLKLALTAKMFGRASGNTLENSVVERAARLAVNEIVDLYKEVSICNIPRFCCSPFLRWRTDARNLDMNSLGWIVKYHFLLKRRELWEQECRKYLFLGFFCSGRQCYCGETYCGATYENLECNDADHAIELMRQIELDLIDILQRHDELEEEYYGSMPTESEEEYYHMSDPDFDAESHWA